MQTESLTLNSCHAQTCNEEGHASDDSPCRIEDQDPVRMDCGTTSKRFTACTQHVSQSKELIHRNKSIRRRHRIPFAARGGGGCAWWLCTSALLLLLPLTSPGISNHSIILASAAAAASSSSHSEYLNEDSVVLITGAAGFLGSELALALHSTYNVKKILCIDSMDSGFGMAKRSNPSFAEPEFDTKGRSEEEFALFEFKRQRAFHLLQILGTKAHFFRADFRPSLPEYYDMGEVPILDYIFKDYPEITHVVHLADAYHSGSIGAAHRTDLQSQAVPRVKEQAKTGMIEVLLEQLKKVGNETGRTPQFTYASSYEVYNHIHPPTNTENPNPPPFREDLPISNPSSLRGASKLIDEIITEAYHSMHGIYSVGLRFFPVYGPWGVPGSPMFEMAERAVSDPAASIMSKEEQVYAGDVRDFVYIDDAVDAIMAAMQFRPQAQDAPPVVINVGSGEGTSLKNVARQIESYFPRADGASKIEPQAKPTISYASTDRAQELLGFKARVPLEEGVLKLLSWHYDRVFPYGGRHISAAEDTVGSNLVASKGLSSCSPFDKECLRGAPIFPCASECSHEALCTTSMYDGITAFTRSLTEGCKAVMYTVALEDDLVSIPSAQIPTDSRLQSFVPDTETAFCNVAFVSEKSFLVQQMKLEHGIPQSQTVMEEYIKVARTKEFKSTLLKHGAWTLVPVITPESPLLEDEHISRLLPKLSPGMFFGTKTKYAIYCDPNVAFTSIPALLDEASMQPYKEGKDGATAVLVPSRDPPPNKFVWKPDCKSNTVRQQSDETAEAELVQRAAYRMIHIGVVDEDNVDEILPMVDSSWLVYTLNNEDTRLLRCDIFGEVVQWNVGSDVPSIEFIMGLHDMWTRSIASWAGDDPWWIGDGVITVRHRVDADADEKVDTHRRLEDEGVPGRLSGDDGVDRDADGNAKEEGVHADDHTENDQEVESHQDSNSDEDGQDVEEKVHTDDDTDKEQTDEQQDEVEDKTDSQNDTPDESPAEPGDTKDSPDAKNGQRVPKNEAFGDNKAKQQENDKDSDSPEAGEEVVEAKPPDDDDATAVNGDAEGESDGEEGDADEKGHAFPIMKPPDRDVSAYDTWMGVLSSAETPCFVRIIPSSEVGVVFLDE